MGMKIFRTKYRIKYNIHLKCYVIQYKKWYFPMFIDLWRYDFINDEEYKDIFFSYEGAKIALNRELERLKRK